MARVEGRALHCVHAGRGGAEYSLLRTSVGVSSWIVIDTTGSTRPQTAIMLNVQCQILACMVLVCD